MILYLEVQQVSEQSIERELVKVTQRDFPPNETVGVELCVLASIPSEEWLSYFGTEPTVVLPETSTSQLFARIQVADENAAKALWQTIKHWFDGCQVVTKLHTHYGASEQQTCNEVDFNPEV